MKKYKALSRIFILSYLVLIFCGVLFGFLLMKPNMVFGIIICCIMLADWINLIVAKHLFKSHYLTFFIMSVVGLSLLNISVVGSFILELVYTCNGKPATYAWMIVSIAIAFTFLIDFFYVKSIRAIHHKKLVEEGIIEEEKEEEV